MALVRWTPTADMDLFRRQMDRLFDEMTGDGFAGSRSEHRAAFDLQEWNPAIELNNAGENLKPASAETRRDSQPQSKN